MGQKLSPQLNMHNYVVLADPEVTQIYTANHTTFPIQIRKITVQICGNFWVTQYIPCYALGSESLEQCTKVKASKQG